MQSVIRRRLAVAETGDEQQLALGSGDHKSVQPMAARSGDVSYLTRRISIMCISNALRNREWLKYIKLY